MIQPANLEIITVADWARLAAFIDGEGCLSLRARTNNKSSVGARICTPEFSVANTDVRLIFWLKKNFGGRAQALAKGPRQQKTCYKWEPKYTQIKDILVGCLPYFIIKREQAEIVIALKTLLLSKPWKGAAVTEAEKDQREGLYKRIHVLNRRGREATPSIYKVA